MADIPVNNEQSTDKVIVYGTSWCPDCHRVRYFLDMNEIEYIDIDIDRDATGLHFVQKVNQGNRSVPTIVFPDGAILVEPPTMALVQKLGL